MWLMIRWRGKVQLLRLNLIIRHGNGGGEGCLKVEWMLMFNQLLPKVGVVGGADKLFQCRITSRHSAKCTLPVHNMLLWDSYDHLLQRCMVGLLVSCRCRKGICT